MKNSIPAERLHNQYITRASRQSPADLVAWLGAVQAQEYPAAKWGLGLRMREGTTDTEIERACDEGAILRTHVMRPTWHFVHAADIRWMLELTAPRVHKAMGSYYRGLELEATTLAKAAATIERALRDGALLTRAELGLHLHRAGLAAKGPRLALMTMYAELEGLVCSGPRRGNQFTYALLARRAPQARQLTRDEALAELTRRYFTSHGPATVVDFVWWSGLLTADAKRGLEINRARSEVVGTRTYWTLNRSIKAVPERRTVYLLPIYDEYVVAYRDREAVPHASSSGHSPSLGSVTFQHALVIDGQVAGTWRTSRTARAHAVNVIPLRRLTATDRRTIAVRVERYTRFLGTPVSFAFA